eukprot:4010442-Alexandrium_andersonii.AAC.1
MRKPALFAQENACLHTRSHSHARPDRFTHTSAFATTKNPAKFKQIAFLSVLCVRARLGTRASARALLLGTADLTQASRQNNIANKNTAQAGLRPRQGFGPDRASSPDRASPQDRLRPWARLRPEAGFAVEDPPRA